MAMSGTRKALIIITSILVGIILVVLIGLAILVAAFREREPSIAQNSVLSLRIAGPMPDYVPEDPIRELLRGKEQSLSSFVLQLKKAKVDDRIKAALIEVNMSGAGLAKSEEIRDAITDFRSSRETSVRLHRVWDEQGVLHRHRLRQNFCGPARRVVHQRFCGRRDVFQRQPG